MSQFINTRLGYGLILAVSVLANPATSSAQTAQQRSGEQATRSSTQFVLREGTLVGPIRGRFVVSGQRWRFLTDQKRKDSGAGGRVSDLVSGGMARAIIDKDDSLLGRNRAGGGDARANPLPRENSNSQDAKRLAGSAIDVVLVTENLALDRIVRAIEEDPDDDRWTITGRITEFRDQNRLTITTAVRSNGKL